MRIRWFGLGVALTASLFAACSSEEANPSPSAVDGGPDTSTPDTAPPTEAGAKDCTVAVIGGGAGGVHTAFRLAPTLKDGVCLVEKEKELGGRIKDVTLEDNAGADAPRVGVGARRVMETQEVLFNLAKELGIELDAPPNGTDLIEARGSFAFSKDDLAAAKYPTVPASPDPKVDKETFLYDQLRGGPERAKAATYPSFVAYIKAVVGEEGYAFLHDMSRFRADFEYPLDARGYLDYLDEEWDVCCQPSYPKGGMSSFIRGMEAKAKENGARIYKDEAVLEIGKVDGKYTIKTAKQTLRAEKVVLAVPPSGVDGMKGEIVDKLKATKQYQNIVGVKVATITQWWPESWWKVIKDPNAAENAGVWRAWSTTHCLNFIEIPIDKFADPQKVTRSVYVDKKSCVDFWEDLFTKGGEAAVEAEIQKQLTAIFNNGVSTPATVTVPKPLKTRVQVWPAAWYWLKDNAGMTNAELATWATEPLPGEQVGLVGEAYNVNRSGWSDAAYKSSIRLLNTKYGQSLPGLGTKIRPFASFDPSRDPKRACRGGR